MAGFILVFKKNHPHVKKKGMTNPFYQSSLSGVQVGFQGVSGGASGHGCAVALELALPDFL